MVQISVIPTVLAEAATLRDVEEWLACCELLGASGTEELLDGAHLALEGFRPLRSDLSERVHLGEVEEWVRAARAAGLGDEARITQGGDALAVDLHVRSTEPIGCGDCTGEEYGHDILVTTHLCTPASS